ncbi:IS66 family insertion sequence element accessory protein TnpB [Acinetobacter baumannii]|jgi:transposase
MIRIDEIWLSTQPMDMRAGMDTAMAQVLRAFGYIKPHCAYLFCNKRGHRMKVLVHDGLGIWLCARRLEQGNSTGLKFTRVKVWRSARSSYRH